MQVSTNKTVFFSQVLKQIPKLLEKKKVNNASRYIPIIYQIGLFNCTYYLIKFVFVRFVLLNVLNGFVKVGFVFQAITISNLHFIQLVKKT